MPSNEPCGGLPKIGISVYASYCPTHMAWSTSFYAFTDTGDEHDEFDDSASAEFGPFDTVADVREWIDRRLHAAFTEPGRPWVSQPRSKV